ncbi:hypothetical protein PQX77_014558 [Marasmius sp. AFHP31]|nr:hypothetical protein PQX77_014558 [Marasmius sp. AFHP31]
MAVNFSHIWIIGLVVILVSKFLAARRARAKLCSIPTIGPDGIFSSYHSVFRLIIDGRRLVEEGCRKYPGQMFKIPSINGWTVILNERNLFHDVCRAPEEVLSASVTVEDFLKMKYTISPQFMTNPYHIQVVQGALNQNMGARLDDVGEELITAFDRLFPITDDWTEFPLHRNILQVIVRASNRLFVGLPLCRNPDYCNLNINFTISVFMNSILIRLFPKVMHPLVGRIFTSFTWQFPGSDSRTEVNLIATPWLALLGWCICRTEASIFFQSSSGQVNYGQVCLEIASMTLSSKLL